MATYSPNYASQNSTSQRGLAMELALITAVVLSPLYVTWKNNETRYYEMKLSSGLVLPMVLAGLIVAIRTSSSSMQSGGRSSFIPSADPSWVLRVGGFVVGTNWYSVDAHACSVMVRICSTLHLEIDFELLGFVTRRAKSQRNILSGFFIPNKTYLFPNRIFLFILIAIMQETGNH